MPDCNPEYVADESFFERLAKVTQKNNQPLPTISEVLDTIKLTLNQHSAELLYDMQGVRIEKLVARLYEYPDTITSSDSPSQLSQLLVPECCQSFAERSEGYELDYNRKLMLKEMLACVAYVSINREEYLSDAPAELYIKEIIPDVVPAPPEPPLPEKPIILASYPPNPDDFGYIIFLNLFDYLRHPDSETIMNMIDFNPFDYRRTPETFFGFCQVPPGAHYFVLNILKEDELSTWCYLQPRQVLVLELKSAKRSYRELRFFEANPETTAYYQNLATTGALNQTLSPYFNEGEVKEIPWYRSPYPWSVITQHIRPPQFPPTLHLGLLETTTDNLKLSESHGGNLMAFLAEFEFAFVSGYVTYQDHHTDRWNQLLQVLCYSGAEGIGYLVERLPEVVDIVMIQLQKTLNNYLYSRQEIFDACEYWSIELIDSGIPIAVEKGQELAACIEDRKERIAENIKLGKL